MYRDFSGLIAKLKWQWLSLCMAQSEVAQLGSRRGSRTVMNVHHLPSSSPLKSAKRMKPGVSSSLLSRLFQTSSKSWAFSGLTCIGRYRESARADCSWKTKLTAHCAVHMPSEGRCPYLEVILCDEEEVGGHGALHKSTF